MVEEYFDMDVLVRAKLNFNQPDFVWLLYKGEYAPFRRERTCHATKVDPFTWGCSECGGHWHDDVSYCPNCGAKVVESC